MELKPIQKIFETYEVKVLKSRRTERGDLLDDFLKNLNPPRLEAGFDLLTHSRLARDLSRAGLKSTHELYVFYKECERANIFSAYFWFKLKEKREKLKLSTPPV